MKILWVLFLAIVGLFLQCAKEKSKDTDLTFFKKIVDWDPPAAEGCCLDVCAVGT